MATPSHPPRLGLPVGLAGPMTAAHDAQGRPGFAWARLGSARYLDVPGLRFLPSAEASGAPVASGGHGRWFAVPLVVLPVIGAVDVWTSPDGLWSKIGLSLVLSLVVALGVFMFQALGPEAGIVGPTQHGLYVYPDDLVLWLVRPDGSELRRIVPRGQVRRFDRRDDGLIVSYTRSDGEADAAPVGLDAASSDAHAWLDRWRETGELVPSND